MYLCRMSGQTGKWMVIIGAVIVVAGLLVWLFHDKLHWIGKLPGDISIEKENFRFYFPFTSMILLSVLISAMVALIRRFL